MEDSLRAAGDLSIRSWANDLGLSNPQLRTYCRQYCECVVERGSGGKVSALRMEVAATGRRRSDCDGH